MITRIAAVSFGVLLGTVVASDVRAYEVSTHRLITAHAVERSQAYNNPAILAELGMSAYQGVLANEIAFGVEAEDLVSEQHAIARVFNHFYDPQFNNYAGRGLTVLSTIGHASPDWALEDRGDVVTVGVAGRQFAGMAQEYSFREAQRDLWYVLTGQDPAIRAQRSLHMLHALGSVVHHLQDMAQPQHTRNEQHAFGPNKYYEGYTQDNINPSIPTLLRSATNQYPIPQLNSARAYWFSQQTVADQVPRYLGMAEFTSHNFISNATGFHSDLSGNLLAHPSFPRPNGINQDDGSRKDIVAMNLPIQHLDGTLTNENGHFVVSHIVDQLAGTTPKSRLVAMSSIFDRPLATTRGMRAFTVSDGVFNSGYDVLLPRASAFSTGLIDYFFRGRVDLRRNPDNTGWVFENRSGAGRTLNGQVSLWYEEESGLRYPIAGTSTFNISNLAHNSANTLAAGEPPASATKVIAAFRGQIGSETADVAGGYFAVAGKVIDYSRPAVLCGAGSSRVYAMQSPYDGTGLNVQAPGTGLRPQFNPGTWELGSTPGEVKVELDFGYLADSAVVRRGSSTGPVIYTTNGFVTGPRFFTFNNPGGFDPSRTRVHVRIDATNSGWTIHLGCPGVELNNGNRAVEVISSSFSVTRPTGFCNSGQVEFFLDHSPAGIVYLPGGGSTFPRQVFTGEHHVRAVTTMTSNTFGCGGIVTLKYHDRTGAHPIPSGGGNVNIQ